MPKKEFLEKLRASRLSKKFFFVVVSEQDNEMTIVVCNKTTSQVECSFTYEESGLIYAMSFGQIGFYELKDFVDVIDKLLE